MRRGGHRFIDTTDDNRFVCPWYVSHSFESFWFYKSLRIQVSPEKGIAMPETNSSHLKMDGWNTSFIWDGLLSRANCYMGVSKNSGTPKSSILIGFSIINHPFWGTTIFGNTYICSGSEPRSNPVLGMGLRPLLDAEGSICLRNLGRWAPNM